MPPAGAPTWWWSWAGESSLSLSLSWWPPSSLSLSWSWWPPSWRSMPWWQGRLWSVGPSWSRPGWRQSRWSTPTGPERLPAAPRHRRSFRRRPRRGWLRSRRGGRPAPRPDSVSESRSPSGKSVPSRLTLAGRASPGIGSVLHDMRALCCQFGSGVVLRRELAAFCTECVHCAASSAALDRRAHEPLGPGISRRSRCRLLRPRSRRSGRNRPATPSRPRLPPCRRADRSGPAGPCPPNRPGPSDRRG